jgi:hypothetical protein
MRRILLAAAIIISLLVASPTLAEKYVYKHNPFSTSGQLEYVPKSYRLVYNNLENRYEWAPKGARLTHNIYTNEWRYIPGIVAGK